MSWKNKCGLNWYWPICVSYKHRGSCQKFTFLEYPIPEIPDDSENKSGMDRVLPKIIGSGIGYPSVTVCGPFCLQFVHHVTQNFIHSEVRWDTSLKFLWHWILYGALSTFNVPFWRLSKRFLSIWTDFRALFPLVCFYKCP